jgi:gliding motility-associated-like protein
MTSTLQRFGLIVLLLFGMNVQGTAQGSVFPFTSGPIPLCDTSIFTANVAGVGMLFPPGNPWTNSLQALIINITTDHPQTLQITLTSPQGTELLLSAFNGAGGENYTNCMFQYYGGPSITTGAAPFDGSWSPQGGSLSMFDYEFADGTWIITVIDTSCANGGTGPNGDWTDGWYDGSAANGGFTMYFDNSSPPCMGWIPYGTATVCPGGTFDIEYYYLSNNNGYSYSYYLNGVAVPDPSAVDVPGSYEVQAIDPWDGCWYMTSFDLVEGLPYPLGGDQTVTSCSPPVDLTALFALSGVVQQWSLDGTSISTATAATASVSGTYQLIVSDASGCGDTALVTLNLSAGPVLGTDQEVNICDGSSVDLTALYNTSGMSTSWSVGGLPIPPPTAATEPDVYTLLATGPSGCTATVEINVVVQSSGALGADQVLDLCDGTTADLTALFNTLGLNTDWTLSGAAVPDPSAVNTPGDYRLVVSNNGACADTAFVALAVILAPELGPNISVTSCDGEPLDLTTSFYTTGMTSSWTFAGGAVDPTTVTDAGSYSLTVMNAAGCSDVGIVNVIAASAPILGPDDAISICEGSTADLTALYNIGSNTAIWTINGIVIAEPTAATSSGTYTLNVTNIAGCSTSANVAVVNNAVPDLGEDLSATTCSGTSFDLTATVDVAELTTSWTLNGVSVSTPDAADATGAYRLVASNDLGCSDTAMVMLTVHEAPSLGADRTFTLCPWRSVDLTAQFAVNGMNTTYTVNNDPVTDPTAVHDAGIYSISVMDANGCADTAVAEVLNIDCLCTADFVQEASCIQEPVHFTLLADSAIVGVQWDFGGAAARSTAIHPVVIFSTDEETTVTLQAMLTCGVVTVEHTIEVDDCSDNCSLYIPSAFSPNGDGINDEWKWSSDCLPKDFTAMVFNRWGELLFSSNDPLRGWDGTYGGVLSQVDVYVYKVKYRLPYQESQESVGSVTIAR